MALGGEGEVQGECACEEWVSARRVMIVLMFNYWS